MIKHGKITADLHNHSTASDGEFRPYQLILKGHKSGLRAIALTDHDSIEGLDEAVEQGQRTGIIVIPGVEVTLRFKRPHFTGSLHLLLYFTDAMLKNAEFRKELNQVISKGRGIHLVKERIDAINREFGPQGRDPVLKRALILDEVTSHGENISRRHFFLALSQEHGIKDKELTDRIIGNSSPAYIPAGIEPGLLTPLFKKYPVIKVLAHPAAGSFPGESHYKEVLPSIDVVEGLLPEFLDPEITGIDGLEVYYPAHTERHRLTLLEWAKRYDLLVTGGSDCHDSNVRPPGVEGVGQDELDAFLKRLEKN